MNPKDIAKEAIKQLAHEKKLPTPENFIEFYYKVAGKEFNRNAHNINWAELITDVLIQLEFQHKNINKKQKIEAIHTALNNSGDNIELGSNLYNLLGGWVKNESGEIVLDEEGELARSFEVKENALIKEHKEIICLMIDELNKFISPKDPLIEKAKNFKESINKANKEEELENIKKDLENSYNTVFSKVHEEFNTSNEMNKILTVMVQDMDKLVLDDSWLSDKIKQINLLITNEPDSRKVKEAGQLFKDVVKKQEVLKKDLINSQNKLQEMLAQFMDNLADFSEDTGSYQKVIEKSAEDISKAKEIGEINKTLGLVLSETKSIQEKSKSRHQELEVMRVDVQEAQNEIKKLREELEKSTELVRIDPLTGVLNRKGMDESLEKFEQIMKRTGNPYCVALLDIDNFKKLNDTLGHHVGDKALIHLAKVVKSGIRPQDTLARYGGEEFVVILDNSDINFAVNVMVRIQRELTKQMFESDDQKILITFSCGVALMKLDEKPQDCLVRADQAMYLAKKTGKNRVLTAPL